MIFWPILAAGLALGGPGLVFAVCVGLGIARLARRRRPRPALRPVLLVMLVELRSGFSALAALQGAARHFPEDAELTRIARVATIGGIVAAAGSTTGRLAVLLAQLARAQRSGSPVAGTVRALLDADIAAERAQRIERARSLPIRLMIPLTLFVLPGMILMLYAPALIATFDSMSMVLS